MICEKCGKELTSSVKFCTNCGAPIPQQKVEPPVTPVIISDVASEPVAQEQKNGWNDKYTIFVLAIVMLVAVIIGMTIKNINTRKQLANMADVEDEYDYGNDDQDTDYNDHADNTDAADTSQDDNQQGEEGSTNNTNNATTTTQEYILPDSSTRYLSKSELVGLTAEQCRIARNEIYARHGRMFNDEGLQTYFNNLSWYRPTIQPNDFQESMLNAYEVANRDLIVQYEQEQGY